MRWNDKAFLPSQMDLFQKGHDMPEKGTVRSRVRSDAINEIQLIKLIHDLKKWVKMLAVSTVVAWDISY
jgi:hypothetical protein